MGRNLYSQSEQALLMGRKALLQIQMELQSLGLYRLVYYHNYHTQFVLQYYHYYLRLQ